MFKEFITKKLDPESKVKSKMIKAYFCLTTDNHCLRYCSVAVKRHPQPRPFTQGSI